MLTTFTYDSSNRLMLANAGGAMTTYSYDPAGNRTKVQTPTDSTYYSWDPVGRMATAEVAAGIVSFTYNADGQRVAKQGTDGSVTGFLYDHNNLLAETDEVGGDVSALYTTGTDQEFGDLIDENGGQAVPLFNAQANTNALLDSSGNVQARYQYTAFGNTAAVSIEGDAWSSLSTDQWAGMSVDQWADLPVDLSPAKMTGMGGQRQYFLDAETQLLLLGGGNANQGGRYYDPATTRFTSDDPIRQAGGINMQQYAGNDPIGRNDPSGHDDDYQQRLDDNNVAWDQIDRAKAAQKRDFLSNEYPIGMPPLQHADSPRLTPNVAVINGLSGGKLIADQLKLDQILSGGDYATAGERLEKSLQMSLDTFDETGISKAIGVADSATTTLAIIGTGAVFAVAAPEVALVVGAILLSAAIGNSAGLRKATGQTTGQIIGGTIGDVTGASSIYAGWKNKDIATQRPLGLTPLQQGQAWGSGIPNFGASLFAAGSLARPVWQGGVQLRAFVGDFDALPESVDTPRRLSALQIRLTRPGGYIRLRYAADPIVGSGGSADLGAGTEAVEFAAGDRVLATAEYGDAIDYLVEGAKPSRKGELIDVHKYVDPGTHNPSGGRLQYDQAKSVLPTNAAELFRNSVAVKLKDGTIVRWAVDKTKDGVVFHRFEGSNGIFHWNGSTAGITASGVDRAIPLRLVPQKEISQGTP